MQIACSAISPNHEKRRPMKVTNLQHKCVGYDCTLFCNITLPISHVSMYSSLHASFYIYFLPSTLYLQQFNVSLFGVMQSTENKAKHKNKCWVRSNFTQLEPSICVVFCFCLYQSVLRLMPFSTVYLDDWSQVHL